ncbi:MAG: DUF882 domain-containing protein [Deltaproteobacteria bacterium]|nr:DUF882 domain-containing protein [Deltaproteobacteria bacterium]
MRWFLLTLTALAWLASAGPSDAATPSRTGQDRELRASLRLPTFQLDNPLLKPWPLLDRFENPSVESRPASARFLAGPWGMARWSHPSWSMLRLEPFAAAMMPWADSLQKDAASWAASEPQGEPRLSLVLWTPSGDRPSSPPDLSVFGSSLVAPSTCVRSPVRFARYGAEYDRFSLLACNGSVAGDAIDRLSVMLRPVGVSRPALPLPDAPDDESASVGEWIPSIRLVHPRLVWLAQQIANEFPGRALYVVSGYRRGEHEGLHGKGRALDLSVIGLPKEELYRFCRTLPDVGCGYYPHHEFVHVDVRPTGTGKAYWVDDSQPGQPSHYVDSWPEVEQGGAAVWDAWRESLPASPPAASNPSR